MIDFFGDVEERIEKEEDDDDEEEEEEGELSVRPSVGGCSCAVGRGQKT